MSSDHNLMDFHKLNTPTQIKKTVSKSKRLDSSSTSPKPHSDFHQSSHSLLNGKQLQS